MLLEESRGQRGWHIGYFLCYCDTIPGRSQGKELPPWGGDFSSRFKAVLCRGDGMEWEPSAAGHIGCTVRKPSVQASANFLLLFSLRSQLMS